MLQLTRNTCVNFAAKDFETLKREQDLNLKIQKVGPKAKHPQNNNSNPSHDQAT